MRCVLWPAHDWATTAAAAACGKQEQQAAPAAAAASASAGRSPLVATAVAAPELTEQQQQADAAPGLSTGGAGVALSTLASTAASVPTAVVKALEALLGDAMTQQRALDALCRTADAADARHMLAAGRVLELQDRNRCVHAHACAQAWQYEHLTLQKPAAACMF